MRALMLLFGCGAARVASDEHAVFAAAFATFDADGDGRIVAAEYARTGGAEGIGGMDADGDGAVAPAEFEAWMRATDPRPFTDLPGASAEPRAASPASAPAASTGLPWGTLGALAAASLVGGALAALAVSAFGRPRRRR